MHWWLHGYTRAYALFMHRNGYTQICKSHTHYTLQPAVTCSHLERETSQGCSHVQGLQLCLPQHSYLQYQTICIRQLMFNQMLYLYSKIAQPCKRRARARARPLWRVRRQPSSAYGTLRIEMRPHEGSISYKTHSIAEDR